MNIYDQKQKDLEIDLQIKIASKNNWKEKESVLASRVRL